MEYIVIDQTTREEVHLPTKRKDFRGEEVTVLSITRPSSLGSTGRVNVRGAAGWERELFPSVVNLRIVKKHFEGGE